MPLNFAHSISKKYLTSYIDRYIRYKFNLKDGNPDFRYGYMTTKERKELVSTVFESELPRVRSAIRAKFCFDTYINASVIYYKAKNSLRDSNRLCFGSADCRGPIWRRGYEPNSVKIVQV